jgi:FKBP-type peptidyl-prolyl cis-trans isomerase FkpA
MKKTYWYIGLALSLVLFVVGTYLILSQYNNMNASTLTVAGVSTSTATDSLPQLKIETLRAGKGDGAKAGDTVTVNYLGTLENGTKFDSSYDRKQTFDFVLGAGSVIEGWDQGLVGMKVGEKRKLTIPSRLGYGGAAQGSIPAFSTLIFEIELVKITPAK